LDESERQGVLDRIQAEKLPGKVQVTRFKGLGEMNPLQLRETTMLPQTRRLVQLMLEPEQSMPIMDMMLAKKRASDRKAWLEEKGDLAEVV
jgi:topoisomerase-4 subunit B